MAGPLARLYATLGLDAREFDSGLGRAQKSLTGFGQGADTALRVAAGAVGAGLAFAAKGAMEMEDAAARFQAATGASAEEAKRFAGELNAMTGRSLVPMGELEAAMTAIRTDLGLTGDEASVAATQFERYMRATGQGADAVRAFDDIQDAWNLTAADTQRIMDTLIAGQQEYGGVLAESQASLAKLAPALQAAGMGWEEGAEFLNLFNAAGVDATAAVTGMTKALGEVRSPRELQDLLRDISATEDPFARAQKAIDLFGARAGPKLAQALQASGGDLARFGFELDEVAGKTEDAARAMDSTLSSQLRLAVNHGLSILRGFGSEAGPVLMAAFSAASLGQALGLGKVFGPLGAKAAAAFAVGFEAIQRLLAPVFTKLTTLVTGWGTAAGSAFAGAAGAGGFIGTLTTVVARMTPLAIPFVLVEALGQGGPLSNLPETDAAGNMRIGEGMFALNFRRKGEDAGKAAAQGFAAGAAAARTMSFDEFLERQGWSARGAADPLAGLGRVVRGRLWDVVAASGDVLGGLPVAIDAQMRAARKAITQGFGSIKAALANPPQLMSREDRLEAMQGRQRKVMRNLRRAVEVDDPINVRYWTRAAVAAAVRIERFGGANRATVASIRKQFSSLGIDVSGTWLDTEKSARKHSRGAKDAATGAARDTKRGVSTILGSLDLTTAGQTAIQTWAAGLMAGAETVRTVAKYLASTFASFFEGHSPPKVGPLSSIDRWGGPLVEAWLGGIEGRRGRVAQAGSSLAGAFAPAPGSLALQPAGGGRRGGDVHVHINGPVYGGPAGLRQLSAAIEDAVRPTRRVRAR